MEIHQKLIGEQTLPEDIIETILTHFVDEFDRDPAYQWTQLRHLSASQMRRIERRFQEFWIRYVSLTLWCSSSTFFDYFFAEIDPNGRGLELVVDRDDTERTVPSGTYAQSATDHAVFRCKRTEGYDTVHDNGRRADRDFVVQSWNNYQEGSQNVTVRMGEGILNGGLYSSYILGDTHLPGLTVSDDGTEVSFRWKDAIGELMREEMFLRNRTYQLLDQELKEVYPSVPFDRAKIPESQQIRTLILHVQGARRVALAKHRANHPHPRIYPMTSLESYGEPHFGRGSFYMHGQPAKEGDEKEPVSGCCAVCSRVGGPDIFEISDAEESMIPYLPSFQDWARVQPTPAFNPPSVWLKPWAGSDGEVWGSEIEAALRREHKSETETEEWEAAALSMRRLLADQFGWFCVRIQGAEGRKNEAALQKERANIALSGGFPGIYEVGRRWDILM